MARGKHTGRYSPSRDEGGGDDEGNRWLGTYADAITLLMAFFVMLYAMSEVDVEKFQAFVAGLAVPFDNQVASASLLPEGASLVDEHAAPAPPSDPTMGLDEPMPTPGPQRDELPAPDAEQLEDVRRSVAEALAAAGLDDLASYRYDERGLVVSIAADDVLFATGSTRVGRVGLQMIRVIARTLAEVPNDVVVEGHTDDVPLQRRGYTNWNLSTDRAVAVLGVLVDDLGFPPGRIGATGYGEYRPVAGNDTAAGRARNRRVDLLVVAEGRSHG